MNKFSSRHIAQIRVMIEELWCTAVSGLQVRMVSTEGIAATRIVRRLKLCLPVSQQAWNWQYTAVCLNMTSALKGKLEQILSWTFLEFFLRRIADPHVDTYACRHKFNIKIPGF